jgi:hypothetical protein
LTNRPRAESAGPRGLSCRSRMAQSHKTNSNESRLSMYVHV